MWIVLWYIIYFSLGDLWRRSLTWSSLPIIGDETNGKSSSSSSNSSLLYLYNFQLLFINGLCVCLVESTELVNDGLNSRAGRRQDWAHHDRRTTSFCPIQSFFQLCYLVCHFPVLSFPWVRPSAPSCVVRWTDICRWRWWWTWASPRSCGWRLTIGWTWSERESHHCCTTLTRLSRTRFVSPPGSALVKTTR